eukprot:TRINITY_DN13500_c0_g1_i1.p1 TRINITY_DN13500_c0_g1~~TRINITY_DN13500_c0_g1_i1.p1  ORF type:complete len:387 (-),score=65.67 TRINITY_DN13500_c0_g1_i1:204-1364(-)
MKVQEALSSVAQSSSTLNWIMLEPAHLDLHGAGHGGLEELKLHLALDKVMFAVLRCTFPRTGKPIIKRIFIHWIGPEVSPVKRGRWNSRLEAAMSTVRKSMDFAFTKTAYSIEDLDLAELMSELCRVTYDREAKGRELSAEWYLEGFASDGLPLVSSSASVCSLVQEDESTDCGSALTTPSKLEVDAPARSIDEPTALALTHYYELFTPDPKHEVQPGERLKLDFPPTRMPSMSEDGMSRPMTPSNCSQDGTDAEPTMYSSLEDSVEVSLWGEVFVKRIQQWYRGRAALRKQRKYEEASQDDDTSWSQLEEQQHRLMDQLTQHGLPGGFEERVRTRAYFMYLNGSHDEKANYYRALETELEQVYLNINKSRYRVSYDVADGNAASA